MWNNVVDGLIASNPPTPVGRSRTIMARMACHLRISQSIETQLQRKHGTAPMFFLGVGGVSTLGSWSSLQSVENAPWLIRFAVVLHVCEFKREEFDQSWTIRRNPAGEARQPAPSDRRCKIHSANRCAFFTVRRSLRDAGSCFVCRRLF